MELVPLKGIFFLPSAYPYTNEFYNFNVTYNLIFVCVHDTAESPDGVAELPDTQTQQQTDVNETYLSSGRIFWKISLFPVALKCKRGISGVPP